MSFAIACVLYSFELPGFDIWLSELPECGAKRELLERRSAALAAFKENTSEDLLIRHLEWLSLRMRSISRAMAAAPILRTGQKVRRPFQEANRESAADAMAQADLMQQFASEKWAEPQHANKSATAIAKLIDPDHWNTTRRKIRRPK